MVDSCVITRPGSGDRVFDAETGTWSEPPPGTVYAGRCRVQVPALAPRGVDAAQVEWATARVVVSIPVAVVGVRPGHTVTITGSLLDPELAGRKVTVLDVPAKSHLTARRLQCEGVS